MAQSSTAVSLVHDPCCCCGAGVGGCCPAGFLEYLDSSERYKTELLRARYEYEQAWNPDWELGKEDALSVSVCNAGSGAEQQSAVAN